MKMCMWRLTPTKNSNSDPKTAEGVGDEWTRFDQTVMSDVDTYCLLMAMMAIFRFSHGIFFPRVLLVSTLAVAVAVGQS